MSEHDVLIGKVRVDFKRVQLAKGFALLCALSEPKTQTAHEVLPAGKPDRLVGALQKRQESVEVADLVLINRVKLSVHRVTVPEVSLRTLTELDRVLYNFSLGVGRVGCEEVAKCSQIQLTADWVVCNAESDVEVRACRIESVVLSEGVVLDEVCERRSVSVTHGDETHQPEDENQKDHDEGQITARPGLVLAGLVLNY